MSVYKQLVWELGSRDTHGVLLLGCTPDVARFVLPEGPLVLVVAHRAGEPARTREVAVTALAQHGNPAGAEIVAAGDPGGLAALGTIGRARLHGVDESGTVTSTHPKAVPKTLAACLREVARNPGQLRLGPDELNAWLAERAAAAQATIGKIEAYQKALGARTPRAVPALIAVTMAVYLLQVLWGGLDSLSVLIRMGAADSSAAHRLDWWRPLSSSFLHGSLLHVGGNMLVLWLIGGFLERILGPWRLLALWMVSVVGGSAAAIAFGPPDSVMVGASGGGWGLMVAAGVISLRGAGVVPEPLAVGMRQSIRNVLVLNLMISFVPGISLMAHLGGGLAGGAMTLLGVATVGMRSPERAATAIGRDAWAAPVVAAGVLSAALLLGSLAAAFVDGRPWASILEGAWVEHETGVSGVRIELPAALGEGRREDDGVVYGDPRGTEYVVTVQAAPFDAKALTSSKVFLEYHRTKKALLKEELPDGFRREGAPIEHEKGTRFELQEQFAVGDGRAVRRTVAVPAGVVTVTVLEAPGVPPLAVRWTFSEP